MTRRLRLLALAVPFIACGNDAGAPAVAPEVVFVAPAPSDGTPPENLALPLTSLQRLSRTDQALLGLATYQITVDCMLAQGFDYPPYLPGQPSYGDVDHPFGPWTVAEVPEGYGQVIPDPGESPIEAHLAAMPAAEAEAWGAAWRGRDPFGGPRRTVTLPDGSAEESGFAAGYEEGCAFHGHNAVHGDYVYAEELRQEIEALVNEAFVDAEQADIVDLALDVWEQCMEADGIDVEGGTDGPVQLASRYGREPGVSDEERQAAVLDIRCKEEANLHDAYFVARAEAEERLIEHNEAFVDAWREQREGSLDRARQIVNGEGG